MAPLRKLVSRDSAVPPLNPISPRDIEAERRMLEQDVLTCEAMGATYAVSEKRMELARRHPLLMARIYFPEWVKSETPDFHWELVTGYMNFERYAVAAPVGSGKTTLLTKICTIWSIFFEENEEGTIDDILIISAAADLSAIFLNDMGNRLKQSEEMREDFGDFIGSQWGSQSLEFSFKDRSGRVYRTAYIRVLGRLGTLRGRRPHRILVDDPQDEESVKSEKQRQDYENWFWGELVNRLDTKHKKLTYVGNTISEETFIVGLVKAPPSNWNVRSLPMLNDTVDPPVSLWPDRWPVQHLLNRKAEIGEVKFRTEFQCDPVRLWHQRIFDMTRVRFEAWKIQDDDYVSLTVDPAFTSGGDAWAITVIAVDRHGDWHEMESPSEKTGLDGWLEELLRIRLNYPTIHVAAIEGGGGGQAAVEHIIQKWMLENAVSLPVQILKHTHAKGPKEGRIAKLTGVVNGGRLTIQPGHLGLYHDLRDYRSGLDKQNDHRPDSLSMHLEIQHARAPRDPIPKTFEQMRHERFVRLQNRIKGNPDNAMPRWIDRYGIRA